MIEKSIIIGCSYNSLKYLEDHLKKLSSEYKVINIDNVSTVKVSKGGITLNNGVSTKFTDIKSSFIRYPYDLIPPHSSDFSKREKTEFFKSIALCVDSVAINSLKSAWALRNRLYSLSKAEQYGAIVPRYELLLNESQFDFSSHKLVKCLGNCFVSEYENEIKVSLKPYLNLESDGRDIAFIFGAQLMHKEKLKGYLSTVGVAFTQDVLDSHNEYRCYILNGKYFLYRRERSDKVDKSSSIYLSTKYKLSDSTFNALLKLMHNENIGYLCFDMIQVDSFEYIIDINPYGQLPSFQEYPEVTNELAHLLMIKAEG